jgi:chromodomain-helicase-DNA-binding protein 1
MMDMAHFEPIRWAIIAVADGHRLKYKDSELLRFLAGLSSANRLLVTETPLQYSVAELWALLHFWNPDHFDDPVAFEDSFSVSPFGDEEHVAELHITLRS